MIDALLRWYEREGRPLPWRRTKSPWPVLLSEVMLQQTRAETVADRFDSMLERFPTAVAMAESREEEVLAAWSGLGYYQRAKRLHRAAREISKHSWPQSAEELRELPGVGRYTAAAVASIAFGEAVVAVDGNVERVMARLSGAEVVRGSAAARSLAEEQGGALLSKVRPGDSNQALMELGARICRPRAPRCDCCPLAAECRAFLRGEATRIPLPRPARRPEQRHFLAVVVRREGAVLLFRRPDDASVLAGLWEVPMVELVGKQDGPSLLLERRYRGEWELSDEVAGTVRHSVTYRRLEVAVREAEFRPKGDAVAEGLAAGWFDARERGRLPLSALARKIIATVVDPE